MNSFPTPKCPKCGNDKFHVVENTSSNAGFVSLVCCNKCNSVVGGLGSQHLYDRISALEKRLEELSKPH